MAQPEFKEVPENVLDFNMQVINPDWKASIPTTNAGSYSVIEVEKDGRITSKFVKPGKYINADDLMTEIDYFSRDIRLSNYDEPDTKNVRWYGSFGGDMIARGYFRAFRHCWKEMAVISETSQGKKGFLRKILQTLTHENINKNMDAPKKNFWTGQGGSGGMG